MQKNVHHYIVVTAVECMKEIVHHQKTAIATGITLSENYTTIEFHFGLLFVKNKREKFLTMG